MIKRTKLLILFCFIIAGKYVFSQEDIFKKTNEDKLPYGNDFKSWEKSQKYSKTYYVDQKHPGAGDNNPGSPEQPFRTINKAAQVLQPGERVVIKAGIYRESIHPVNGGSSPKKMICYESAPGEDVFVKGSVILAPESFSHSEGWQLGGKGYYSDDTDGQDANVYEYNFQGELFNGYNPFAMLNLAHDRSWVDYKNIKMDAHFKRRGMIFLDGHPLHQVMKPIELSKADSGAFWVEHHGLTIHVKFPFDTKPSDFTIEATVKERLVAPKSYGTGYIKIKGIHFIHAGNGFPVPQRGMVSTSRGHHWIIEDCMLEWANALGVDMGNEMWHTVRQPVIGYHIFRGNIIRNCGLAGLEAMWGKHMLIEDNLFEKIGWHDAEHGWEAGAIKLHKSEGTLIRRNIFRNIVHAPGIWLDYKSNKNCRITKNVFASITTARGAVYVEVSRHLCRIDHNVFYDLHSQYWISGAYGAGGCALYTDGSDSIIFDHNLALDIENAGFGCYANADRIVGMRGGTERDHEITRNIFVRCDKHAIELPNKGSMTDYNVFAGMKPGYMKMSHPEPALLLDLQAWQNIFGWEKHGQYVEILPVHFNTDKLTISISEKLSLPDETGPLKSYKKTKMKLDPRQIVEE
jgi:hypothetical protein